MPLPAIGAVIGAVGRVIGAVGSAFGIGGDKAPPKKGGRGGGGRRGGGKGGRGGGGPPVGTKNQLEEHGDNKRLNWLWQTQASTDLGTRLLGGLDGFLPAFAHTITVSAVGGPEADLRRVWYLVLAAAFGRYRNRASGVQGAAIEATWDVTGKAAAVSIAYTNSGLVDQLSRGNLDAVSVLLDKGSGLGLIHRGPDQVTIGGSWPAFTKSVAANLGGATKVIGGALDIIKALGGGYGRAGRVLSSLFKATVIPQSQSVTMTQWNPIYAMCGEVTQNVLYPIGGWSSRATNVLRELPRGNNPTFLPWKQVAPIESGGAYGGSGSTQMTYSQPPALPDDGRLITTGEKFDPRVQSPKPNVDGIGRSSLIALVAQALSVPCYLPASPPCPGILASPGLQVYPAGQGLDGGGQFNQVTDQTYESLASGPLAAGGTMVFVPGNVGADGYKIPASWNAMPGLRRYVTDGQR